MEDILKLPSTTILWSIIIIGFIVSYIYKTAYAHRKQVNKVAVGIARGSLKLTVVILTIVAIILAIILIFIIIAWGIHSVATLPIGTLLTIIIFILIFNK